MNPDEETTSEDVTLVIESAPGEVTPDVDAGDTTVIVAPAESSNSDTLDPFTERFVRLETRMDAIESTAYSAQYEAENAAGAADDALAAVDELAANDAAIIVATDEAIVESIEDANIEKDDAGELVATVDDITPTSSKVHPLFRTMRDWRS